MIARISPLTLDSFLKVYSYDFLEAKEAAATLSGEDQLYARVGRVALTLFTLGILPTVCWLKWGNQQASLLSFNSEADVGNVSSIREAVDRIKTLGVHRFVSYFKSETNLINLLNTFSEQELKTVLETSFREIINLENGKDLVKIFDELATLIPLEKIAKVYSDEESQQNAKAILLDAQKQLKDAKHYFIRGDSRDLLQKTAAHLSDLLDSVVLVIEGLISTLGLADFFKPAESAIHAEFKSQKIMMLFSIFSMLTTVILPLLGAASGGLVVGAIFLSIAALSLIWPWIKPIPSHLPANAENWTKEIQQGAVIPKGRKQSLKEIARTLKTGRHAMLVGPSRTGKSLTAKSFAKAVEQGKWPELKGKKVFRINMADIVDQAPSFLGGGNSVLNEISEAMGRHRDDIILVFDEIHNACIGHAQIAEKLKPFLDEGGHFPHVIGITTDEEYETHVKPHYAFSQRFDRIKIASTGRKETIKILAKTALQDRSRPIIDPTALNEICSSTHGKPQPYYAVRLLKDCINRIGKASLSQTEEDIESVEREIKAFEWDRAACHGKTVSNDQTEGFKERKKELEKKLKSERKANKRLLSTKACYDRVIKKGYQQTCALSEVLSHAEKESHLKRFWMMQKWLAPFLKQELEKNSKECKMPLIIDKDFVRSVAATIQEKPAGNISVNVQEGKS